MNRLQARLLKCEVRVVFMTWFRRRRLWRMLHTLAPGVFAKGGGAGPMQSAYGQFVSILYASMVILFEESGPRADRTFGECRAAHASCSGGGSPRTLAIMNRLGQEHRDGVARAKQRGDLIGRLRAMRDLALPAKRADLNVCEADIEAVNGVNDGTVQTLYSTMPLCFCFASCSGAALQTRNTALFSCGCDY